MPFGGLGFSELLLIFAVLLLLFGAKRLPELASGMGKGIRDFKRALNGMDAESVQNSIQAPTQAQQVTPGAAAQPVTPPSEAQPQAQPQTPPAQS